MRFLENLVSDMVKQSTGYNPRRVIRKIGGKNLLMAGAGAVLAGALANASNKGQGTAGPPASRPPASPPPASLPPTSLPSASRPPTSLPPLPGGHSKHPASGSGTAGPGAPPPLPAAAQAPPTGVDEAASAVDPGPEATFAIVRTMVAAALADGHLSPEEKAMIQGRLGESGLAAEQVRQIHQDLVLPPSPAELAAANRDPARREMLFRFAALVTVTDEQLSALERRWLDQLAAAFELSAERQRSLEEETLGALRPPQSPRC